MRLFGETAPVGESPAFWAGIADGDLSDNPLLFSFKLIKND